jgi:hypothetical protein
MNEVIGFEYKDGSYVPYAETYIRRGIPENWKRLYIHKAKDQNVIVETDEQELIWVSKAWFDNNRFEPTRFNPEIKDVVSVEFVGNMLCVSTKNDFLQYIYDNSKNTYELYSNNSFYYDLPSVRLRVSRFVEDSPMEGEFNSGNVMYVRDDYRFSTISQGTDGYIDKASVVPDLIKDNRIVASLASKATSLLAEHGRLTGYVLAIGAYRLKTGQYILASSPVLLNAPNAIKKRILNNDFAKGCLPMFFPKSVYTSGEGAFNWVKYHFGTSTEWSNPMLPSFSDEDIWMTRDQTIHSLHNNSDSNTGTMLSSHGYIPSLFAWFNNSIEEQVGSKNYDYRCYMLGAYGNVLQYSISPIDIARPELKKKYERTIDSYCIFLSPEISYYKEFTDKNVLHYSTVGIKGTPEESSKKTAYYSFRTRSNKEIFDDIRNISSFYKVHEIPFAEICESNFSGEDYKNVDLKGKLGDNLLVQETLHILAFNQDNYIDGIIKSYNYMLHHADYKKSFFRGYDGTDFSFYQRETGPIDKSDGQYYISNINSNNTIEVDIRVLIKDDDGESEVWHRKTKINYALNPIIAYPNKNAYRMEIYYTHSNGKVYKAAFDLSSSRNGGYAYYAGSSIDDNIGFINVCPPDSVLSTEVNVTTQSVLEESNSSMPQSTDSIIDFNNTMRVSNTGVTNVFDYENYYKIGNDNIISIARLTISLSQDTFGQYPLLVFCKDGIYSMQVNTSGTGTYNNIAPFSREVCTNPNTICEIDGAVLFASSKGLMIATAQGVQEFVPALNGKPTNFPQDDDTTKGLGLKLYKDAINNTQSALLGDCISYEDFIAYLSEETTVVTYASEKNKVVVYNAERSYIYWIDIPTRNVTKLPICIKTDNNNYPSEQYVSDKNEIVEFKYLSADKSVQCLLQSRPIKVNSGMKSYIRVIARGYYNSTQYGKYAVMLVLGSYDGINWQPLGIKQKQANGGFHDLGCVVDRVSCKYIMVIISGTFTPDSHIDGIELTKENKYNNKLK